MRWRDKMFRSEVWSARKYPVGHILSWYGVGLLTFFTGFFLGELHGANQTTPWFWVAYAAAIAIVIPLTFYLWARIKKWVRLGMPA